TDVGNIVDHVLQSLNEQVPEIDAGKNVETSETHEDVVKDSVSTTPVDNTVSNQPQGTYVVITEGNTHPDESENANSKGDGSADKTMVDNTDTVVVDVDKYAPESPVK
ncbi:hypothetical protein A2U01_0066802, partial [Trifolium medium]|nr:hypothetical protein [Trifolium medium]